MDGPDVRTRKKASDFPQELLDLFHEYQHGYISRRAFLEDAKKFAEITYMDVLKKGLKVMDSTAISLCKDNNLPIIIFNLNHRGNIRKVITGEKIGSLVSAGV